MKTKKGNKAKASNVSYRRQERMREETKTRKKEKKEILRTRKGRKKGKTMKRSISKLK
jgi:hypothetical protein